MLPAAAAVATMPFFQKWGIRLLKGIFTPQVILTVVIMGVAWFTLDRLEDQDELIQQQTQTIIELQAENALKDDEILAAIGSIQIADQRSTDRALEIRAAEDIIEDILSTPEEEDAPNAPVLRRTHARLNELLHGSDDAADDTD